MTIINPAKRMIYATGNPCNRPFSMISRGSLPRGLPDHGYPCGPAFWDDVGGVGIANPQNPRFPLRGRERGVGTHEVLLGRTVRHHKRVGTVLADWEGARDRRTIGEFAGKGSGRGLRDGDLEGRVRDGESGAVLRVDGLEFEFE